MLNCYFFPVLTVVASLCGWMLICTVVQVFPVRPSTMPHCPHRKTLSSKTSKSGPCRTEGDHLKRRESLVLSGVAELQDFKEHMQFSHYCSILYTAVATVSSVYLAEISPHTVWGLFHWLLSGHSVYTGLVCACSRDEAWLNPVMQSVAAINHWLFIYCIALCKAQYITGTESFKPSMSPFGYGEHYDTKFAVTLWDTMFLTSESTFRL